MKLPRKIERYCGVCKTHTTQKCDMLKAGGERPKLSSGARRHERRSGVHGFGGQPHAKLPQKGKTSHKTQLRYTCEKCGKSNMRQHQIWAKKVEKE